jgi:exosortase O
MEGEEAPMTGQEERPTRGPGEPAQGVRRVFAALRGGGWAILLANAGLVALWAWLFRAVFPYLKEIFTREEFRTNQIVLAGAVGLILLQARKGTLDLRLNALPQYHPPAVGLALGCAAIYLVIERLLDINTLSATLFGLASYGLIGLWLRPRRWRQGLPAALLLVGALPFGEHMQTFIGYPVRILTAAVVRDGLAAVGVPSVSVDTILVLETGISKVDLPCSGVKSLWTGGLFFIAATWIDRRPVNLRWLLAGAAFAAVLLAANLVRVAALVLADHVAGWRLLAEMLHMPLGVMGFVAACGVGLLLLRWAGKPAPLTNSEDAHDATSTAQRPVWLAPLLAGLFAVMALVYTPRPDVIAGAAGAAWQFPSELAADAWPLNPGEQAWLDESGAKNAQRWHFVWRGMRGSMLMVTSDDWRAHHRPERCFEVYGLDTETSWSMMAAEDFPVRLLRLDSHAAGGQFSAAYWLQAGNTVTDDYATRIWADLSPQRQEWVLVTVLFDDAADPASPDAQALYRALRQSIAQGFTGEEVP